MSVRPAGPDDAPAIAVLERSCLGADAWSEELVREGVTGSLPTISYLVAEDDDRVVGHATVSVAGDIAELQRIAVDPAYRRRGLASALLDATIALARGGRADPLLLEVREDNPGALSFYAAREFVDACLESGIEPTSAHAFGWDLVVAVRVAARAEGATREGILRAFRSDREFVGATGPLSLGQDAESPALSRVTA